MTQNIPGRLPDAIPHGTKLQEGTFVAGKVLGQSRDAITYFSAHRQLKQRVAIKEFFPDGGVRIGIIVQPGSELTFDQFAKARAEFLQRARVTTGFSHDGIAKVLSSFEENETVYLVTEFVKGEALLELLGSQSTLSEEVATAYILQIGVALQAVHEAGLVHGGVRTDNVIVDEGGRAVLVNFGRPETAFRVNGIAPIQLTEDDEFAGPSASIDGCLNDIYDLGATFYQLLTGQSPLPAPTRLTGGVVPSPQQLNPAVSKKISDAVMWALELSEAARPRNVEAFAARLHVFDPLVMVVAPRRNMKKWVWIGAVGLILLTGFMVRNMTVKHRTSSKIVSSVSKNTRPASAATIQPLRLALDRKRQVFVISSTHRLNLQNRGMIWTTRQEGNRIVCKPKKYPVIVKLLVNGAGKFFLLRHDGKLLNPGWTITDYRKLAAGRVLQTKISGSKRRSLYFRAVGQPAIQIGTFIVGESSTR